MSDIAAAIDISEALHTLLSEAAGVRAVLGQPPRLYDHPPEDAVFPYLTYGPMRSEDKSADGAIINAHMITLHIWSRYGGRAEVLNVLQAVTQALQTGTLALTAVKLVRAQVTYTDVFRAPDGMTLHGLIRFSLITDSDNI